MNPKNIITTILILLASVSSAFPQSPDNDDDNQPEVTINGIHYRLAPDSTATITYYFPSLYADSAITIPSSIIINHQSFIVKTIAREAFRGHEVRSITLPATIDSIGPRAFLGCYYLTHINLPSHLRTIPDGLFWACRSLTDVTIPDSLTRIEDSAFKGCSSLTTLTIPDGVTTIGDEAFSECSALLTLTLGTNIKTIGRQAFYRLHSLQALTLLATEPPVNSDPTPHLYHKTLLVPAQSLSAYQSDPFWKYMDIHPIIHE